MHEWETIYEQRLEWSNDRGNRGVGVRYHVRCKKCGWIRKIDCK